MTDTITDILSGGAFTRQQATALRQLLATVVAGSGATLGDIAAAVDAHELEANPHPVYLTQAEGDALYAPIGGSGLSLAQALSIASLRI